MTISSAINLGNLYVFRPVQALRLGGRTETLQKQSPDITLPQRISVWNGGFIQNMLYLMARFVIRVQACMSCLRWIERALEGMETANANHRFPFSLVAASVL
jgi:hypothetical protein